MKRDAIRQLPHVTVATVVRKNNKFLLVQEESAGKKVYNQPAGHLELDETLIQAAVRETWEETGWRVRLTGFLGISQYKAPNNGVSYLRHSFIAEPIEFDKEAVLDKDIIAVVWLSYEEVLASKTQLRSPMVLNDIARFRSGSCFDMALLEGFL